MVSARLVDHPDSPEEQQMRPIPKMMFAAGEEPVGVRVLTYQSSSVLKRIFNALEEDEVEIIRQSSFVEVVTVSSLIKMLYRKTVKDKEIRIKYACLALLESVLLPTSLNMKISREHAEAIEDLGEFFASLWGRLSFDLLMGSIKERDEIGLSQNTIVVKGFVLGLQLVLVEAVPALTEVVDDTGSSSESDVKDLDGVGRDIFRKKHTLNPAHARSVDKRTDVIVHSILDDDPLQPLDAGNLAYSDEEQDSRVENLVEGIKGNINYNYSSFEGGMRQIDVECMRQSSKGSSKSKKANNLHNNVERIDPSYVAATVIEKMKPRLDLLEKNQNAASSTLVEMEGRVVRQVESVLVKFKEDMINSVKDMVSGLCKDYLAAHVGPQYVTPPVRNDVSGTSNHTTPVADQNEVTIRNVLRNLSDYSTPPRSTRMSQDENRTPTMKDNHGSGYECVTPVPPNGAQSANSESRARQSSFQQRLELHKRKAHNVEEEPSFSLGLTQEEQSVGIVNVSVREDEFADLVPPIHVADNIEERQLCRKSKRQKTVPSGLLETYQCGPHLLSRLREYRKFIFLLDDMSAMERKFEKLSSDVKRNS
ncbi:hypothetical protein IGI04_040260 [Brassica rapa subsp. trilocularis]|uniref:DUF1985 domain-containing protein n=1 Tax=Brassica rapa subsp. trilocularis TaxID=1813537 RepID=A0ABQ7KN63_BRACM|nr:hypothetical protein IGI04_040260 [Brassica rapa subsp. trilocularis]